MNDGLPELHFTHANSFPATSYRKFLAGLAPYFDIGYIDMLGHDPAYPVTDCWPHLVDESLRYIESRYSAPVVALGHSLGGFISFLCAIARPDLFCGVVLLDSPIFCRHVSGMLWLGKRCGFIERLTPGRGARTRRRNWRSAEEAVAHFSGRGMFAEFDEECLRDYILCGTEPVEGGIQLRFQPEVEYRIYCGLPHTFPTMRGQLVVPTAFIGGSRSHYVRSGDLTHMREKFGIAVSKFDGGHLFPFEAPVSAAAAVREAIESLGILRTGASPAP